MAAWLDAQAIDRLDLVIHNAGTGYYGPVADQSPADLQALIALNLRAPIALTHALLPRLDAAQGKLVFVSSVASALATPDYATYTATKAALDGFARSLRIEQAGRVRVQVLHPGAVNTGLHAKIGIPKETLDWDTFPSAQKRWRNRWCGPCGAIGATRSWAWATSLPAGPGSTPPPCSTGSCAPKSQPSWKLKLPGRSDTPKHCLITGAADGIGKALATRYAQAGYIVTGIDIDRDRAAATQVEVGQTGANIGFILADLTQADEVARVVSELSAWPGL